jgi:transposase InsO family protein
MSGVEIHGGAGVGLCADFSLRTTGLSRERPRPATDPGWAQKTDNGSAMLATEVRQGLETLGIVHETTLPYSPYQYVALPNMWR